jgi:hypothetical protein
VPPPNEGVEKLKDIFTLSFWLYFRLKIAPYFKYKSVKSTQKYSRPLSVYYIFLNSTFLQAERRAKRELRSSDPVERSGTNLSTLLCDDYKTSA